MEMLCDEIVVVAPSSMALPVPAERRVDDPDDPAPGSGPLAAVVAGLRSRAFDEALVLAVDLPLLTSETLAAVRARRREALAVVPAPGGIPQPLAAWYGPAAVERLAAALAAGERSVTRAVLACSPVLLDDEALIAMPGGLEAWLNVNTPADLAEAERRLGAGRRV
jgi:molybdopterin-guanine dinucleotide biosynthesis protein A